MQGTWPPSHATGSTLNAKPPAPAAPVPGMRHPFALALVTAVACGSKSPPPAQPMPEPTPPAVAPAEPPTEAKPPPGETPKQVQVDKDTPRTTDAGAAYTVPAGWKIIASGQIAILEPSEPDSHLALVDALGAKDADAAVAMAWKLYRSDFTRPLKIATDDPPREGWDQIRTYAYEVSPNEKRLVIAIALRKQDKWTVVLLDATQGTLEKRGAQFALVGQSLKPAGHNRESFQGKKANKLDAARLAKIDAFVELGLKELGVPGAAVAIVQGGKVIHARGYGVRELGKKTKVDADTLFIIASNTKALTTLLLAQLVDAGKLRWDQKVVEAYPDFKLGTADVTASTQIKHLICACTGLPRQDLEWLFEFAKATPLSELGLLATVQPTTKFGETFQYSNLLAAAAGYVGGHVVSPKLELGKAYDQAMKKKVFGPLGMKHTTFDFKQALRGNHAAPHAWNIDTKSAVARMDINYSIVPARPAGGAWSSARDLIRYVQLELGKGVAPGGKRIVSEANLLARREPQVKIGEWGAYGMGLSLDNKYGVTVVDHGGSMIGFKSNMIFLPDQGVGAVILTNSDEGGVVLGPFQRYLLEQLFDGKPEAEEDLRTAAKTIRENRAKERPRLVIPPDPAEAKALAARYDNAALGSLGVSSGANGSTVFDLGEWKSAVASRKNDDGTISLITIDPGTTGFEFVVGKGADGARTLTIRDAQHEYVFVEKR